LLRAPPGEAASPLLELASSLLLEAQDVLCPVRARLALLGRASSSLDAFYRARPGRGPAGVGARAAPQSSGIAGDEAAALASARAVVAAQYRCWRDDVLPGLVRAGTPVQAASALAPGQADLVLRRFREEVLPALTPLAVHPGHPLPLLRSGAVNVALFLSREGGRPSARGRANLLAFLEVPAALGRVMTVAGPSGVTRLLLCDVIRAHAALLFPGFEVQQSAVIRVTRCAGQRVMGPMAASGCCRVGPAVVGGVVRLELQGDTPEEMVSILASALEAPPLFVERIPGPLRLQDLQDLAAPLLAEPPPRAGERTEGAAVADERAVCVA
jgi:polyphosphate kinase